MKVQKEKIHLLGAVLFRDESDVEVSRHASAFFDLFSLTEPCFLLKYLLYNFFKLEIWDFVKRESNGVRF